jgi:ADP-ribose pyrophosphatase YjhB (NUDIX family)
MAKVVLLKREHRTELWEMGVPWRFLDRGERVEAAPIRETWEEVNLKVEVKAAPERLFVPTGYPVVVIVYVVDIVDGGITGHGR